MSDFKLRSFQFRKERESHWTELEHLLSRVNSRGLSSLDAEDLHRLPVLYRSALSSLSVARSISLDRNLLDYLEALCARSYVVVYGAKRRLRTLLWAFVTRTFPVALRGMAVELAAAIGLLALGCAAGFMLTEAEPERFYSFVDAGLAGGRGPTASCEVMQAGLYDGGTLASALTPFAAFLFSHNARIGLMCFALGFAAGVPTALLLFTNGLMLGAFASVFHQCGLDYSFWGWVLPHGVTELLAICLCGAAGLRLGRGVINPGRSRRRDALARAGRQAAVVALGSVGLFFIAGGIEGMFRQLVTDDLIRWNVAFSSMVVWLLYFGFVGRSSGAAT
ncbi:MAG: putative membrane protein SpoIIM required for sporulation [Myxococcota bacterium]|jgi:uncharacterized membrane protein SpoIIM required for sporulation